VVSIDDVVFGDHLELIAKDGGMIEVGGWSGNREGVTEKLMGGQVKWRDAVRPSTVPIPASGQSMSGQDSRRLVALTFDDGVRSHLEFVAPLLRDLGFGATFFVTHAYMSDEANFLDWEEIARLHQMGFEIGNHSWANSPFHSPEQAARLASELHQVEEALAKVGVPKPVSLLHRP
jgi:peptidoglycan/xylan/chitin deacetylase (PgdA/CDA1 family)